MNGASGETKKTIVINGGFIDPDGSLIHSSSRRKGPANKTLKNIKPSPQSKEISKQVLQKIRDRYKNTALASEPGPSFANPVSTPPTNQPVEENRDLVQSIDFLEKLTQNVQARPPTQHSAKPHELHRSYTPQYGCLKRGLLPTYRTMMNTTHKYRPMTPHPYPTPYPSSQQLIQPIPYLQQGFSVPNPALQQGFSVQNPVMNPAPFLTQVQPPSGPLDQEIKDLSVRQQFAEMQQGGQQGVDETASVPSLNEVVPPTQNYQKRTVRRTHRVGRSKRLPVVSVLLPNRSIRSRVATHSKTLKTLPMPQVKNSLVKTGMIKIGSDAPENVLREIYENMCLIGGPVMNYNPDVLYYNMLHNS
jgi:hypothetical protein